MITTIDVLERIKGCMYGLMIGDALAMPAHWYYDTNALTRDYGRITRYRAPRHPHPDSILWRSRYQPANARGDILHEQANHWGHRGVHYHQFLEAGENTLNLQLVIELLEQLVAHGGYDSDSYAQRYIQFMTTPGKHRDTYVEECHRHFFDSYARGVPIQRCGAVEKHIGGLVSVPAVIAWHADSVEAAVETAVQHVQLTHKGALIERSVRLLGNLLFNILAGQPPAEAIGHGLEQNGHGCSSQSLHRWLALPDHAVIGARISSACYLQDALTATLYLALKYADRPADGLVANVHVGGDNAHRGAVLGAVLGAAHGMQAFPDAWIDGLRCRSRLDQCMEVLHHDRVRFS